MMRILRMEFLKLQKCLFCLVSFGSPDIFSFKISLYFLSVEESTLICEFACGKDSTEKRKPSCCICVRTFK